MESNREEFLKVLFDEDDNVAWGRDDQDACRPQYPWPMFLHTNAVKFCINPLSTWRDGKHTTAINSLLFEMDYDDSLGKDKKVLIPIKKQIRLFEESGIPYSSMVYSGGKSVHVIVRFKERIDNTGDEYIDKILFQNTWKAIERVLSKKDCFIDLATMKIPQLSRIPGSIRDVNVYDDVGNITRTDEVEQKLIFIKERVSMLEMTEWLKANDEEIKIPKPKPPSTYTPNANDIIDDVEKWTAAYNMWKSKYGEFDIAQVSGNWNNCVNIGSMCYKVDLGLSAAIGIANQKLGGTTIKTGGTKTVLLEEGIRSGWEWAESNNLDKIKLTTKEEYKALQRTENDLARQKLNKIWE